MSHVIHIQITEVLRQYSLYSDWAATAAIQIPLLEDKPGLTVSKFVRTVPLVNAERRSEVMTITNKQDGLTHQPPNVSHRPRISRAVDHCRGSFVGAVLYQVL